MDDLERIRKAREIIELRKAQLEAERGEKLNQYVIAEESGVSQTVISLYLRGNVMGAKYGVLMKFLKWLGVSPDEFARELGLW